MRAEDRRRKIILRLIEDNKPISGTLLADEFCVSRQIIVQDIALLKASGYDIISTHYGYVLQKSPFVERVIKIYHTKDQTETELTTIVEMGGTVADVFVWHRVYGKMKAELNISSKYHINKFMDGIRSGISSELMNITGGYHYHTIRADSEKTIDAIVSRLKEKNLVILENES